MRQKSHSGSASRAPVIHLRSLTKCPARPPRIACEFAGGVIGASPSCARRTGSPEAERLHGIVVGLCTLELANGVCGRVQRKCPALIHPMGALRTPKEHAVELLQMLRSTGLEGRTVLAHELEDCHQLLCDRLGWMPQTVGGGREFKKLPGVRKGQGLDRPHSDDRLHDRTFDRRCRRARRGEAKASLSLASST